MGNDSTDLIGIGPRSHLRAMKQIWLAYRSPNQFVEWLAEYRSWHQIVLVVAIAIHASPYLLLIVHVIRSVTGTAHSSLGLLDGTFSTAMAGVVHGAAGILGAIVVLSICTVVVFGVGGLCLLIAVARYASSHATGAKFIQTFTAHMIHQIF